MVHDALPHQTCRLGLQHPVADYGTCGVTEYPNDYWENPIARADCSIVRKREINVRIVARPTFLLLLGLWIVCPVGRGIYTLVHAGLSNPRTLP